MDNNDGLNGCIGLVVLLGVTSVAGFIIFGSELFWLGPVIFVCICVLIGVVYLVTEKKRERELARVAEEKTKAEKERLERELAEKQRREEEARRLAEENRLRQEKNRIEKLQAILEEPLPSAILVDDSLIDCDGVGEASRINRAYKALLEKYNEYLEAENEFQWIERKRTARGNLGIEETQQQEEGFLAIKEKKDNLYREFEDFDTERFYPSKELEGMVACERVDFLESIRGVACETSLTSDVDKVFFKDVSYIGNDSTLIFFFPAYCVIKSMEGYSTLEMLKYDELSVKKSSSIEIKKRYSKKLDEVVKVSYLHQNRDGTRDKRYTLDNNPEMYHLKRGAISFELGNRKIEFSFRTGKEADKIEIATRKLIEVFGLNMVKKRIDEDLVKYERYKKRVIRSTK